MADQTQQHDNLERQWIKVAIGVIAYVGLGQLTQFIPNPMLPRASLALNIVVPVIIGYWSGSRVGALVGVIGTALNFLVRLPFHGPDFYEALAIIPHGIMGAISGWRGLEGARIAAAATVFAGHLLNIASFTLAGLLPRATLGEQLFWSGLLAESVIDMILIALIIGLGQYFKYKKLHFSWEDWGWRRFITAGVLNCGLLLLLGVAYLNGVKLALYLLVIPVVIAALLLGIFETWITALLASIAPAITIINMGLEQAPQEVAFVLTLGLAALVIGELTRDLQQQRMLAQARLRELEKAYAVQAEADRLKDEMVQNVSHELRTPLSMVMGYTELLNSGQWGELSADQCMIADKIAQQTKRLSQIVEQLTALQDLKQGQMTWHSISLPAVVQMLVNTHQAQAAARRCTITLHCTDTIPLVVGDPQYLGRAVQELLDNAIKFSPEGGPIEVKLWAKDRKTYLSIRDHGIGIPVEHQQRLFTRFYQVDGSTTRRFGGLGMGLALVKEVIRVHEGDVWVRSRPGAGSDFGFWLPNAPD